MAAKEACVDIFKACQLWRKHDYDANGYSDYVNLPLSKLFEISFVNGKKKRFFDKNLSLADLKLNNKKAYHGYFFTIAVKYRPWPVKEGTDEQDLYILARPQTQGKTGSCIFLLDMNGQSYYTNTKINSEVPSWPSSKELKIKLWKEFSLLES